MLQDFISRLLIISLGMLIIKIAFAKKKSAKQGITLLLLFLIAILAINNGITAFASITAKKPLCPDCNVIIIVPELLRADYVGLYSGVTYTPSIDAFFNDSWLFTNYYGTSAWTLPAHASTLTGLYPHNTGLQTWDTRTLSNTTLADFLLSKGYATVSLNGGNHLGEGFEMTKGFQAERTISRFDRLPGFASEVITKLAVSKQKFFLLMSGYDLHPPYSKGGNLTNALNYTGILRYDELNEPFFERIGQIEKWDSGKKPLYPDAYGKIYELNDTDVEYYKSLYASALETLDYNLEEIFSTIKKTGLENNTLIILLSDHGEELYEHWIGHSTLYEGNVHVPLLIKFPGSKERIESKLASSVDIFPTITSILGFNPPKNLDGVNLLSKSEDYVIAESGGSQKYMIMNGSYKLIMQDLNGLGETELYDLKNDPKELNNLAGKIDVLETKLYLDLLSQEGGSS